MSYTQNGYCAYSGAFLFPEKRIFHLLFVFEKKDNKRKRVFIAKLEL